MDNRRGYLSYGEGNYYEGDKAFWKDTEVPPRPSHFYDLVDGQWIINREREGDSKRPVTHFSAMGSPVR